MVLSTISPSPPSSLDPPSPHPIWCNPFRAPSSPLCTPFPISKTVLLIINTYLLFATAHSFYVHRSLKYSKKSWSFTFLILTLFWALLRQLFFALSLSLLTPFPLSLFYLLYWLPSPLQFSSFMILPLFYAELFHVKLTNVYNTGLWIQGAGSTKHRTLSRAEWVFKWVVRPVYLSVTFAIVAFMITWIVLTAVSERDEREVTVQSLRTRVKHGRREGQPSPDSPFPSSLPDLSSGRGSYPQHYEQHTPTSLYHESLVDYSDDSYYDDDDFGDFGERHYHQRPLPVDSGTSISFRYITAVSFLCLTVILASYSCVLRRRYFATIEEQERMGDTPRRRNSKVSRRRRRSEDRLQLIAQDREEGSPTGGKLSRLMKWVKSSNSSPPLPIHGETSKSPRPKSPRSATLLKHFPWLTPFGNWSLVLIFFSRSMYHFGEIGHYWSSPSMILVATADLSIPVTLLFILWDYVPTFCVLFTLNLHHEEEAGGRERRRRRKERQGRIENRRRRQPSYGSIHDGELSVPSMHEGIDMGWGEGYQNVRSTSASITGGVSEFSPSDSGGGSFMDSAFGIVGSANSNDNSRRSIPDYGVFSMIGNSGDIMEGGPGAHSVVNVASPVGSSVGSLGNSVRGGSRLLNANPRSAGSTDGSFVGSFAHKHGMLFTGAYGSTVWGAGSVGSSVEDRGGGGFGNSAGSNSGRGGMGGGRVRPSPQAPPRRVGGGGA